MRSKLENISRTSKELGRQAQDQAEELAQTTFEEGPPSVGDAEAP